MNDEALQAELTLLDGALWRAKMDYKERKKAAKEAKRRVEALYERIAQLRDTPNQEAE